MPIDITANQERHHILGYYYGDVDLSDIQEFNTTIFKMFGKITYDKLHVIADVSEVKTHNIRVIKAWEIIRHVAKHEKMGIVIVIGIKNPSTKFLNELPRSLRYCWRTPDQAARAANRDRRVAAMGTSFR